MCQRQCYRPCSAPLSAAFVSSFAFPSTFETLPLFSLKGISLKNKISAVLGGLKQSDGAVVVHPTAYDGCLELACLQLGYPVCGSSLVDVNYKCAKEVVKNHLLQGNVKKHLVFI